MLCWIWFLAHMKVAENDCLSVSDDDLSKFATVERLKLLLGVSCRTLRVVCCVLWTRSVNWCVWKLKNCSFRGLDIVGQAYCRVWKFSLAGCDRPIPLNLFLGGTPAKISETDTVQGYLWGALRKRVGCCIVFTVGDIGRERLVVRSYFKRGSKWWSLRKNRKGKNFAERSGRKYVFCWKNEWNRLAVM